MVLRRTVTLAFAVLTALTALTAVAAATDGDALNAARVALQAGDIKAAGAAYGRIDSASPLWSDRIEDAVRWQLLAKHPTEAWRLVELARRTGVTIPGMAYYRALAALKGNVCVLNLPAEPQPWRLLLEAHMYRFPSRYQQGTYRADPYDEAAFGKLQHHLDPLQTHWLSDIPSAVLLPGTGCRWFAKRFSDRKTASGYELAALTAWYALTSPLPADPTGDPGRSAAELRLAELAAAHKDADLPRTILARYAAFGAADWARVPDPERRFVWQQLILLGLLPKPPYQPGEPKAAVVLSLVQQLETPDAAVWMGLIDLPRFPPAVRAEVTAHLLQIEGIPDRPYLLAKQAEMAYQKGDAPAALAVIRRLLLLDEAEDDGDVQAFAAALAARIFTEYHYNDAMLGAVQSSLPAGDWGKIFRRLLVQQALLGDAKGFRQTQGAVSGAAEARTLRLSKDELDLLAAMATRQPGEFARRLNAWAKTPQASGRVVSFLAEMGETVLQLAPAERQAAGPYLQQVSLFLRARLNQGQGQRRLVELMRLYSQGSSDAFMQGSETAREGTVRAGVVDLSQSEKLPYPFVWSAPTHLPLRDLLVQPLTAAGRAWEIR